MIRAVAMWVACIFRALVVALLLILVAAGIMLALDVSPAKLTALPVCIGAAFVGVAFDEWWRNRR